MKTTLNNPIFVVSAVLTLLFCAVAHAQNTETATGTGALVLDLDSSGDNTADGYQALYSNTAGYKNTAAGCQALYGNTTGYKNTAAGYQALYGNTTGYENTATGFSTLVGNTTGFDNTASGGYALNANTTGQLNTATGYQALYSNTSGYENTANGFQALSLNTTGRYNTADGLQALDQNTTGENNIAIGVGAGTYITTGNYNIEIGNPGAYVGSTVGDTNTIRIGAPGKQTKTLIVGIWKTVSPASTPVYVNQYGLLGTLPSSMKFKRNIHDMGNVSDALLALRPVTFQYKSEIDPTGAPQFGLVAEEVEKVSPDLVVHDADHQIYSVRYEAVNAMLLNEFQKEHAHAQDQDKTIAEQQKTIAEQQQAVAEQQKLLQSLAARLDQLEQQTAKK